MPSFMPITLPSIDAIEANDAAVLRLSRPEVTERGAEGDRAGLRMEPILPSSAPNPFEALRAKFSPRGGGGDSAPSLDGNAGGGILSLAGGVIGTGTGDAGRSSSLVDSAELSTSSDLNAGLVGEVTTRFSLALCSDSLRSAGAASVLGFEFGVGSGELASANVAFVGVAASALSSPVTSCAV